MGIVDPIDETAMAELANVKAWLDKIDAMLAEDQTTSRRLALLRQRKEYGHTFRRWCAHFGLTPADRIVAADAAPEGIPDWVPMPDIGELE